MSQSQPATNPSGVEIQRVLVALERRNWWSWVASVVVMLVLLGGIASLSLPGVWEGEDLTLQFQRGLAVRGLLGLLLLFSVYTLYQQAWVNWRRHQAVREAEMRALALEKEALSDSLTGLYNRRYLEQRLRMEVARAERHRYPLVVLMIDLDHLKLINDGCSHAAGDRALVEFASRLKRAIRSADVPARVGGDEFVVLLPDCSSEVVPRVLSRMSGLTVEFEGQEIPLHFSAGWVDCQSGEAPEQVLRRADEALYQDKRTHKAEEQIRLAHAAIECAQQMELVGQLAGGVAHDFNNLFGIITGYSGLLLEQLGEGSPLRPRVEEIARAAERASLLTQQLLAFAQRQVVQPRMLDLNRVLAANEEMLRRLVGENTELVFAFDPALGRIRADPGQIEQVLLHLAINAREAMSQAGQLTLETRNVELDESYAREHEGARPGRYVMLAVKDGGMGMDEETQAHIFEPFYTTKDKTKNPGLGLAAVYGIVKQNHGYIEVESELGRGTTVSLYLRRLEETATRDETSPPGGAPRPAQQDGPAEEAPRAAGEASSVAT